MAGSVQASPEPALGVPAVGRASGQGLRQLLLAQSLSTLGFRLMSLALPIVAAGTLHATPLQVGAVGACQTVPFLVIGLPAGVWVDRWRKRPVMVAGDVGRAVALLGIPLAWWRGDLSVGVLCAVSAVVGVLTVFFDVANQSYLPHVVPQERLLAANSALVTVEQVAGVAGPGLGGLIVQLLTAPVAFLGTTVGFLWSAVCLSFIREQEPVPERTRGAGLYREVVEGIRYIVADRLMRAILLTSTTVTLFWSLAYGMLLVLLAEDLAVPTVTIGVVLTIGATGGVLATLVVRRVITAVGDANALKLSMLLTGPLAPLAALAEPGWGLWPVAVASFALSGGIVLYNVAQVSFRQRSVPPGLLGRVNATVRFTAWGARPVGTLLGGMVATLAGTREAVLIGGVGTALAFVWLYLSPLRGLRDLPVPPTR